MARQPMWEIEVKHTGLGKYRHIRGSDKYVVEQKARYQQEQWEEQWQRKLEVDRRAQKKERDAHQKAADRAQEQRYKEERKQEAAQRDSESKAEIDTLKNILNHTLDVDDTINWDQLKDFSKFAESPPKLELPTTPTFEIPPPQPAPATRPVPPQKTPVSLGIIDKLFGSRRAKKEAEAETTYNKNHAEWATACKKLDEQDAIALHNWSNTQKAIDTQNAGIHAKWEQNCEKARMDHNEQVKQWEQRKEKYYDRQKESNTAIDQNRENYLSRDPGVILDYCDMVLSNSVYPDYFPREWDLDYSPDSKILVVEYALPSPETLPTVKDVQYIPSKDDFKESYLSEKEREAIYDSLLYQIALRTIHELFEADSADALSAVTFNGIVTALEKATGHHVTACVMSVMVTKEAFLQVNLSSVDPKTCFKSLKGVAAAKLTGITPVAPVMVINKEDRRIVASYGVIRDVNEGTNLASMDWEDFEHLIREVFENEFSVNGGEVKVTQASRDGGVDAIAFDPDPIRGGKIVIQAKRYTNTVGVSAVRDLYGTVINEGATKGILVTTASYGPDAYEFAQGKPLSLLSGSNLLHLLEKHGHKARINLSEAKQAAMS